MRRPENILKEGKKITLSWPYQFISFDCATDDDAERALLILGLLLLQEKKDKPEDE